MFLDRFFSHVDETVVTHILSALEVEGGLITGERWTRLKRNVDKENMLYPLFIAVLNFIQESCADLMQRLTWRSEPHTPPKSDFSFEWKPDVVCVPEVTGTVAWRNVCIPVEVKKANDGIPALPQLVGYARECLREQPNRRPSSMGLPSAILLFKCGCLIALAPSDLSKSMSTK
jgi:hypothetical protein